MQDLVELLRFHSGDDISAVHHLAVVQIEQGLNLRLGGLDHHRPLIDQPELLVLDGEADRADLFEVVLHLSADFLQLAEVFLFYGIDLFPCGPDRIESALVEFALKRLLPGNDVAGVEVSAGRVLAVVSINHRLDEQCRVPVVHLVQAEHVADAFQRDLQLVVGIP